VPSSEVVAADPVVLSRRYVLIAAATANEARDSMVHTDDDMVHQLLNIPLGAWSRFLPIAPGDCVQPRRQLRPCEAQSLHGSFGHALTYSGSRHASQMCRIDHRNNIVG
jgi:hypothetical protein